jgi:hypothetical protein
MTHLDRLLQGREQLREEDNPFLRRLRILLRVLLVLKILVSPRLSLYFKPLTVLALEIVRTILQEKLNAIVVMFLSHKKYSHFYCLAIDIWLNLISDFIKCCVVEREGKREE